MSVFLSAHIPQAIVTGAVYWNLWQVRRMFRSSKGLAS